MKNLFLFVILFLSFGACSDAPKSDKTTAAPSNNASIKADSTAITEVVHNFYKWYAAITPIEYIDSKGKVSKLDMAKVAAYHTQMMSSGFISKVYIDADMAYLKKYEAIWAKDKENAKETPLSGADYDRVFCGQDWDEKAYATGAVKIEGLGTNQVKASIEASKLELVKENDKWLISKITCE